MRKTSRGPLASVPPEGSRKRFAFMSTGEACVGMVRHVPIHAALVGSEIDLLIEANVCCQDKARVHAHVFFSCPRGPPRGIFMEAGESFDGTCLVICYL